MGLVTELRHVFGDACKTFTRGYGIGCWLLSLELRRELKLEREMAVSRWYSGLRAWVALMWTEGRREPKPGPRQSKS